MIFEGELLWAEAPGARPAWTRGRWRIDNGRIAREETRASADLTGFAIPGFADSHAHLAISPGGPVGPDVVERHSNAQVATGVLAVRDCGSPNDSRWIHDRPGLVALKTCGRHIARPKRYIRGLPLDLDDPATLPEAVADEASRSDGWVKIVGDWIDRSKGADSDLEPLWPRAALVDAVAAAHEAGAKVAVHCFSHAAVDDLIDAGVDDIEHASGMDADQVGEAASRGIVVTPTLLQIELFTEFADQAGSKYPVYASTMRTMWEQRREHFEMLLESGIRLIMGTDSGGYQDHGTIASEFDLWLAAGVEPEDLLDTATWRTRDALGFDALHEGASADLLVYDADPRSNPTVWTTPDWTILRGEKVTTARR